MDELQGSGGIKAIMEVFRTSLRVTPSLGSDSRRLPCADLDQDGAQPLRIDRRPGRRLLGKERAEIVRVTASGERLKSPRLRRGYKELAQW